MKKNVSPLLLVVVGICLVAVIAFFAFRIMNPPQQAYTISPPSQDADGATAKRANYMKAHGGQAPPGGAASDTDTRQ